MARRRWASKRSSPDMGWVVGASSVGLSFPAGDPDQDTAVVQLFDFADIDPEALTGRIEADKSDWFIKRAILNIVGGCQLDGLGSGDWFRMCSWGLTVADTLLAESMAVGQNAIFGPEWYNQQARILQTGLLPVYMPGVIPYAAREGTGDITINVTSASGSEEAGWLGTAPFWGPAHQQHDISVSNAGLRNNQACCFYVSTVSTPIAGYQWQAGDVLNVRCFYQVLLQKRR